MKTLAEIEKQKLENLKHIFNSVKWIRLPEIMSVQDAAAFINCSVQTIYRLINKKDLPAVKRKNKKYVNYQILKITLQNFIERSFL